MLNTPILVIIIGLIHVVGGIFNIGGVQADQRAELLQVSVHAQSGANYGIDSDMPYSPAITMGIVADKAGDYSSDTNVPSIVTYPPSTIVDPIDLTLPTTPPESAGPPDDAGPKNDNAPDFAGPPDNAGPKDDQVGNGFGNGNGNAYGFGNGNNNGNAFGITKQLEETLKNAKASNNSDDKSNNGNGNSDDSSNNGNGNSEDKSNNGNGNNEDKTNNGKAVGKDK